MRRIQLKVPHGQSYDSTFGVVPIVAAGMGWAILTPLCLLDAVSLAKGTVCAPLPSPGSNRQVSLVARAGELGGMPHRMAVLARQALESRCVPEIRKMMPWLGERLSIGHFEKSQF